MQKEDLLKLFTSLTENDIKPLPDELAVCWYPSSGNHYTTDQHHNGYQVLQHWREQPSKLKPNFFIFSDIHQFHFPPEAEILFSKVLYRHSFREFLELIENPEMIPKDHELITNGTYFVNTIKRLFFYGLAGPYDIIPKPMESLSPAELQIQKRLFNILVEDKTIDLEEVLKKIYSEEIDEILNENSEIIKQINIIHYDDLYFLLVQSRNELVYKRLLFEGIQIPMMVINRPWDQFILEGRFSMDELGIKELIGGQNYITGLNLAPFTKHPDFVFQSVTTQNGRSIIDMANLYSLR